MPLNSVFDLRAPHVVAHAAHFFAQPQHSTVVEANKLVARLGVDLCHGKALLVACPLIGKREQIRAVFYSDRLLFRTVISLHVNTQLRFDAVLVVDVLDAHKGVVGSALGGGAGHNDLLHQLQLERAPI